MHLLCGECILSLQKWTFGVSGDCSISLVVPRYQVSVLLPIPGVPRTFAVVGQLMSTVTGGGIIWSRTSSGIKCLVLRFRDRCNNTRSIGGFTCELSAFMSNSSHVQCACNAAGCCRGVVCCMIHVELIPAGSSCAGNAAAAAVPVISRSN